MSETVKSFQLDSGQYNVARASAIAQDEVLSLLTQGLIQRLAVSEAGKPVDENMILFMFLAMSFETKKRIDALLLSKVFRHSAEQVTQNELPAMEWNKLRAKVLIWNLEDFFTFWANESAKDVEQTNQAQ